MKKFLLCAVFIAASFTSIAQVGIGTTTPNGSAALDIESTTKGLLLPRLTMAQRDGINTNVKTAGLIIFCTDCSFYGEINFFNGTNWSGVSKLVLPTTEVNSGGGTFLTFKNHNLGADTSLNPHVPVKGLNGDYYQWGKKLPDATVDGWTGDANEWGDADGDTDNDNWSPDGNAEKDPCPDGYRVPSKGEWDAVVSSNIATKTGTWFDSETNFGSALHFGSEEVPKLLTLPAAGYHNIDGNLNNRGNKGRYWSSTDVRNAGRTSVFTDISALFLSFDDSDNTIVDATLREQGLSVRCIAE